MKDYFQLNRTFSLLGRLLKESNRVEAVIFNPILKGVCYENRIHEAAAIVALKMPQLGCVPDVITYNILIDGCCKQGEVKKAKEMLQFCISKGLKPNVVTYTTIIGGLCNQAK